MSTIANVPQSTLIQNEQLIHDPGHPPVAAPVFNRVEAELFLKTLTGSIDTPVMWQCFNDHKDHSGHVGGNDQYGRPKCPACHPLTKSMFGTLAQHLETLVDLNGRGAGIFIQVNDCSGKRGIAGVTGLRAVFIDEDGKNDDGTLKADAIRVGHPALTALPPTLMVQSAHGPHAYWVLRPGEKLDDFKPAQKQLAAHFKTDPVIHNLDRVMRVPGFLHKKDPRKPFLVKVVHPIGCMSSYTIQDVLGAYPAPVPVPVPVPRPAPKLALVQEQTDLANSRADVVNEVQPAKRSFFGKANYGPPRPPPRTALEKAKAYLAKVPPTLRSGAGNEEMFEMAAVCVHDFALSPQDAIEALQDWNQQCLHPREPEELRDIVQNAMQYAGKDAEKPRGWRLDRQPAPTPPTTASSVMANTIANVAALVTPIAAAGMVVSGAAAAEMPATYRACYKTAGQLLKEKFEPPEVLAPYIIGGNITEIDGEPKAGKTTFTLSIVRALLTGESFLGEETVKSRVLYLNESPEGSFAEGLKRANIPGDCADDLHLLTYGQVGRFGWNWPQKVADAVAYAKENGIKVLVVDTFSQWADITGEGENQAGTMLNAMAPLHAATAAGLAVVIIRHDRKSGGHAGQSARGSSVVAGSVDNIVHLTADEKAEDDSERRIEYRGRHSCFPGERVVTYDTTTGEYTSLGDKRDVEQTRDQLVVRKALYALGPATEEQIVEQLTKMGERDIGRTKLQAVLMALRLNERISRRGAGVRGNPYVYELP